MEKRTMALVGHRRKRDSSMKAFQALVDESIGERECRKFVEGLNNNNKLALYKTFGIEVEFKEYFHGMSDAGTRLLFKFRSGTHGLNEELGVEKEGKSVCCVQMNVRVLVMYCGNVQHIVALELTSWCSFRQALEVVIHALRNLRLS